MQGLCVHKKRKENPTQKKKNHKKRKFTKKERKKIPKRKKKGKLLGIGRSFLDGREMSVELYRGPSLGPPSGLLDGVRPLYRPRWPLGKQCLSQVTEVARKDFLTSPKSNPVGEKDAQLRLVEPGNRRNRMFYMCSVYFLCRLGDRPSGWPSAITFNPIILPLPVRAR